MAGVNDILLDGLDRVGETVFGVQREFFGEAGAIPEGQGYSVNVVHQMVVPVAGK